MDTLIYYMYVIVDFRILIKKFQSRKVKKNSKQKIINKISKNHEKTQKKSNFLFVLTIFVERDGESRSNRNLFLISLVLVVLAEETSTT